MFIVAIILLTCQLPLKEIKYLGPISVCPSTLKTQFTFPLANKLLHSKKKTQNVKTRSVVFT